jgi:hypothetical protein
LGHDPVFLVLVVVLHLVHVLVVILDLGSGRYAKIEKG